MTEREGVLYRGKRKERRWREREDGEINEW